MHTYTFAAAVAAVAAGVVAIPSPAHAADTNPPILLSTVPDATWNGWYPEDTTIQVGATELGLPGAGRAPVGELPPHRRPERLRGTPRSPRTASRRRERSRSSPGDRPAQRQGPLTGARAPIRAGPGKVRRR